MASSAERPSALPDHFVDFFKSGQPEDVAHYWPFENAVTASVEMVVQLPSGEFKKIYQPIVAKLQRAFPGQFIYRKPIQKPNDVRSLESEENRSYPNANYPGRLFVIGLTCPMYRRPNHGWGELQEAFVVAERRPNSRKDVRLMIFPVGQVDDKTRQQAFKDLTANTFRPGWLDGLSKRILLSYTDPHTLAPHDLHL